MANARELTRNRRRGRPPKSGAYSPICRQEFLQEYPEIRRKFQDARDGLIIDQLEKCGGKTEGDLPTALVLDIDRQVNKIVLSQQIEIYIRRHGILRRDQLKRRQVLEPEPILVFWLQLQNSIDRGLAALGFEQKRQTEAVDLGRYISETYGPDSQAGQGEGGKERRPKDGGARTEHGSQAPDCGAGAAASRDDQGEEAANE